MQRVTPADKIRPYGGQSQIYDAEYRAFDQDVHLLRDRLWRHGVAREVLELGCGTGRIALPLVRAGYAVTGMDISAPMLRRARTRRAGLPPEQRAKLRLSQQDMTTFRYRRRFGAILAPFGALTLLPDSAARAACLQRCRAHLDVGGPIWVDIAAALPGGPLERTFDSSFRLPDRGHLIEKHAVQRRSTDGVAIEIEYHYRRFDQTGQRELDAYTVAFRLALLDEATLLEELDAAGFDVVEIFGDWQAGPPVKGSPRCIVEAIARA
jgi:SAM-dependent methyltransferase